MPASHTKSPELALSLRPTDPRWLDIALADLDAVYCDHLHCERKAAQSALSLVRGYPDHAELVAAVTRLAHEETSHVIQVHQLMGRHGMSLRHDVGDEYAHALRKHIRKNEPHRLLDSLIVFALIEGRSAERLGLLAGALSDPDARSLYRGLASAEVRHRDTFLGLAHGLVERGTFDRAAVTARVRELAARESEIIAGLPIRARIH